MGRYTDAMKEEYQKEKARQDAKRDSHKGMSESDKFAKKASFLTNFFLFWKWGIWGVFWIVIALVFLFFWVGDLLGF